LGAFHGRKIIHILLRMVIQYSDQPMKALFWSAVITGVLAVPLLVVIVLLASKTSVVGTYTASRTLIVPGWISTVVMGIAAALMLLPR
jgi:Mn2+/Fe2+ NRAMP family transporter